MALVVQGTHWWDLKREYLSPEDLLNRFGLVRPPIDVHLLARMMDVEIRPEWDPSVSGRVKVDGADAYITETLSEPIFRRRFTIAHELGHLMLHHIHELQEGKFRDTNFEGDIKEAQANGYAAGLLMPLWMVAEYGKRVGFQPDLVAQIFGVSRQAAAIRLQKVAGV